MATHSNLVRYISAWNDPKEAAHLFSHLYHVLLDPRRSKTELASVLWMSTGCRLSARQLSPALCFVCRSYLRGIL